MNDPPSRVRTRGGHDSLAARRRTRSRRGGGVTASMRDDHAQAIHRQDELDFGDEDAHPNLEATIRVNISASNVPGRARRRWRQRRGLTTASTHAAGARNNHDDLDFTEEDGLPEQRPTIRPTLPPSYAPKHVRDLFTLHRRAQLTTVGRENGIERLVAGVESNHVNIKTDLAIRRVNAYVPWVVMGIIFEYGNGKRQGSIDIMNSLDLTDNNIERCGVGWTDIEQGDYIVAMHGHYLADNIDQQFRHSVTLEFASGRRIQYASQDGRMKGRPFSIVVPQPCLIYRIVFKKHESENMIGLVTSLHLPLSRTNASYLPPRYKKVVSEILSIVGKVDEARALSGRKALEEDVWWSILGFVCGWDLEVSPLRSQAAPLFRRRSPLPLSQAEEDRTLS